MPNYRDENIKLAKAIRGSLQYSDIRVGWLGKIVSAGIVNPNPMDGLDLPYIWVRFEQNGEAVRAINLRVDSRMANVRVRVGRDRVTGELSVLGLAEETALEIGEIAGTLNTPSRISDLITELIDPLRIKPLRVRPGDSAFDVYVEGGYYWHNGEMHGWTGDFINIASSVPGGVNTKRPVLIGIDPATDTLTSYDGDVIPKGTAPMRGKYFPQDVIAQTVNDAGNDVFWIACIPLTVSDTDWRDVLRVTALQFTGNAKPALAGHGIRVNGTGQTVEANLNFLNGNGITIAGTDDPGNTENELTFTVNQTQLSLANLGTRAFLNLSDVPTSYTSQALKGVRVNAGATALEFYAQAFTLLSDVPNSYSGQALKIVRVNAAANALEFATPSTVGHIIQDGTLTNYTQRRYLRFTNTSDTTWTFSDDSGTDATELTLAIVPQTFNWLSDVTISSVATEDIPVYSGSAWVNRQYWTPTRSLTQAAATTSVVDATLSHTLSANNAQIINGLNALGTVNQAGFNATATNGAIGISAHGRATGATGTVTGIAGGVFLASQTGGGTVTGASGVYIKSGVKSAGTLTTLYGQYIESQTAGGTNYAIYTNAGSVQFNDQLLVSGSAGGRTQFVVTGANGQSVDIFNLKTFAGTVFLRTGKNGNFFVTAEANTGGPEAIFGVTGVGHTSLSANTEWTGTRFNFGQTYQFLAGATTLQRFVRIDRPTITGASATAAFTRAVTFSIGGEPNVSTNASATSALALYVERGRSEFGGQVIYPSMAASGTQIDGEVWQDSTRKMLTQFTSGINQYVGGMTWVKTNTTTHASSASEIDISGSGQGTLTLPANFFSAAGKTLRIKVWGYYGTDVSAPTIRIKIKFGSTVILDTGAQTATASVTNQGWDVEGLITCRTAGASGTVIAQGLARLNTSAIAAVLWDMENTGTTTIDTTATQAVTISWQWGTSHANNTASNTNMLLEAVA